MTPAAPDTPHHLHLFTDHRWAVAAATAMYALAATVMLVMAFDAGRDFIQPLDDTWHDMMVNLEWGPLTVLAATLDVLGSVWITLPLRITLAIWLASRTRWAAFTVWMSVWLVSELSIGVFKNVYERARPLDALVETTGFSFPSGHAVAGAATAVALVIVLLRPGPHRRIWELRAALLALVMAMSRTYLRAHWLTDVLAGALLGAASAVAIAAVVHWWRVRRFGRSFGPIPAAGEVPVGRE